MVTDPAGTGASAAWLPAFGEVGRGRGWRTRRRAGNEAVYGRGGAAAAGVWPSPAAAGVGGGAAANDEAVGAAATEEAIVRLRHATELWRDVPHDTLAPKYPFAERDGACISCMVCTE